MSRMWGLNEKQRKNMYGDLDPSTITKTKNEFINIDWFYYIPITYRSCFQAKNKNIYINKQFFLNHYTHPAEMAS